MGENLKLSTAACGLQFLSWAFCLILRLRSQITGFSFRVTAFSFRIRAYSFRIRGFSFRIRVLVSEPGVFSFRIFLVSESGFLVSESGVLVSESGVLVSEPGVLVSESGVLVSEPGRHRQRAGIGSHSCLGSIHVVQKPKWNCCFTFSALPKKQPWIPCAHFSVGLNMRALRPCPNIIWHFLGRVFQSFADMKQRPGAVATYTTIGWWGHVSPMLDS